jgi:probable rRNA maturation factor
VSFTVTITAETGRAFVPFLRKNVIGAHELLVAWASRPSIRGAAATARRSGETPKPPKVHLGEMSLALVNDARMSELHAQFMGIHGPTDVLTFPIDQDDKGHVTSGEVIVCVPQARRAARRHRIPPRLELLLYALHGMLHLLGYDDRTARDFHTMHRTEDDILERLGFGRVFDAAPAAPAAVAAVAPAAPPRARRPRPAATAPAPAPAPAAAAAAAARRKGARR